MKIETLLIPCLATLLIVLILYMVSEGGRFRRRTNAALLTGGSGFEAIMPGTVHIMTYLGNAIYNGKTNPTAAMNAFSRALNPNPGAERQCDRCMRFTSLIPDINPEVLRLVMGRRVNFVCLDCFDALAERAGFVYNIPKLQFKTWHDKKKAA